MRRTTILPLAAAALVLLVPATGASTPPLLEGGSGAGACVKPGSKYSLTALSATSNPYPNAVGRPVPYRLRTVSLYAGIVQPTITETTTTGTVPYQGSTTISGTLPDKRVGGKLPTAVAISISRGDIADPSQFPEGPSTALSGGSTTKGYEGVTFDYDRRSILLTATTFSHIVPPSIILAGFQSKTVYGHARRAGGAWVHVKLGVSTRFPVGSPGLPIGGGTCGYQKAFLATKLFPKRGRYTFKVNTAARSTVAPAALTASLKVS